MDFFTPLAGETAYVDADGAVFKTLKALIDYERTE
jgi:hypothetical protein